MVDRLVNSEANARRINNVEQCFGSSGQRLGIPGRVLVGEGVLTKMCRKKPKPRQFFLFNDALVYGNIIIHKKRYNKQHIIGLENVKLENVEDSGSLRNGWKLKSPSKSFLVFAATATEKKEWMAHINKCVNDRQALMGAKSATNAADSPVWVPDSDAKVCMHCRKSEFTVVNRRHHCRHCGIVACNACTSKKWLLPQQSSKPIRVCLTCHQQLAAEAPQGGKENPYGSVIAEDHDSSGEDSSDDDDDAAANGDQHLAIDDLHFQSYD